MGNTFALGAALGALVAAPAFAGGIDVSSDAIHSDDVVLVTYDGTPLDINGDGDVDLAVASNAGGVADSSRYYYGNGDGTFSAPELLSEGDSSEIAAGDLNGDTFPDLVQGRRDLTNLYYLGDSLAVAPGVDIAADAHSTSSVALGDLDLDGDLDVVTGNGADMTPQPNRFYLNSMTGGGTLSFTGADISPDADVTRSIVLADIDDDDDLDVLAGNAGGGNRLHLNVISIGTTVAFAPGPDFGDPDDQTSKILVGDLDLDGNLDVVTLNLPSAASSGVNRFFMNTSFGLEQPVDVSADTDATSGGALADFDGDGDLDLAVANLATGMPNQSPRNKLYLNQLTEPGGTVTFAAGIDISADEHNSRALAAADLNGDQALDIIVGNENQPDRRYLNNGTADPFTNVAPVIVDQAAALRTNEGAALTITLTDVTVTDPDNVFPDDFTLTAQPGANYTASGATITPDPGFAAALLVPVVVNDGTDNSAAFSLTVSITPAPRSGGSGGGAFGILPLLTVLVFLGLPNWRRKRFLLR